MVLVDGPQSVASSTSAVVGKKLMFCWKFEDVLYGTGSQGQIPQCPLLNELLRLLGNGGRVQLMSR